MTIYYNTLDSDGMMVSSEPFEASEFDVRAQFEIDHKGATSQNTISFGLIGLSDQNNGVCTNFLLCRMTRGSSNNISLERVHGSAASASSVLTTASYTINNNVTYWTRMTYVGGHVRVYITTSQSKIWGAPVLDYRWVDTNYPCPVGYVSPGKGQCGIFARITPLRFGASAIDSYSTCIPITSGCVGDFGSWPSSGKLSMDGEYMAYGAKTPGSSFANMIIITAPDTQEQYDNWQTYYDNIDGYHYQFISNDSWSYNGYILYYASGLEINAAWKINSGTSIPGSPHNVLEASSLDDSGHADTNYITSGQALFHEYALSNVTPQGYSAYYNSTSRLVASIVPGLTSVSRGQNDTSGAPHVASTAYLYEEDQIVVYAFECYDYAKDYNTQDLLDTTCRLAQVEPQFRVLDSGSLALSGSPGIWSTPCLFDNSDKYDVDILLNTSLADGQEIGVGFRSSLGSSSSPGLVMSISRSGSNYYANLYDAGTSLVEQHLFAQAPAGAFTARMLTCFRGENFNFTFPTIYLNEDVYTCCTPLYPLSVISEPRITFIVARGPGTVTVDAYSLPELGDWREAVYLDPNSDGQGALNNIITERFIKNVSHSGDTLEFSAFDNHGASLGVYGALLSDDQPSQEDSEMFSYIHYEATDIKEALNADLIAQEGFLVKSIQSPTLDDDPARQAAYKQLRATEEMTDIRNLQLPSDMRLELEDKITIGYTTVGSIFTQVDEDYIINDLTFNFAPGQSDLKAGVRQWESDDAI